MEQTFKTQNPERKQDSNPTTNREAEFADEIYIFVNENSKGLKFYDRAPSEPVQKFAGRLPQGVFLTDIQLVRQVEWDSDINVPNGTKVVRYVDGSNNATTYIVSAEKFQEISAAILVAQQRNETTIRIDTRSKEIIRDTKNGQLKSNGVITLSNLAEIAKNSQIGQSDIIDIKKELNGHQFPDNKKSKEDI